jgi:hypothetical protein
MKRWVSLYQFLELLRWEIWWDVILIDIGRVILGWLATTIWFGSLFFVGQILVLSFLKVKYITR